MSKAIRLTESAIEEIYKDFVEAMKSVKMSDGKFTFTKTLGTVDRKATLYFSELAYLKMITLVREFDKEVAWHGIAYRGDDPEKDEYVVSDILVYPQEVTGATVNTDQKGYEAWLMSHDDDVFNNIRMQGHSHVNMGTTPSAVDTSLYDRILEQLDETMFYIFLIWNKRGEKTIKIYDLAKNVLFETSDITVVTLDEGLGIADFLDNAKAMVKEKAYSYWNKKEETKEAPKAIEQKKEEPAKETKKKFDTTTKRTPLNKQKSYGGYDDYDSYYYRGRECYDYWGGGYY